MLPPRHRQVRGMNARVPWRTLEDGWILSQLDPHQARALEPLLHQQARSDLRFRRISPASLEALQESRGVSGL